MIVSNAANIAACAPSHGKTGPELSKARGYALPGGNGPIVINADMVGGDPFLFLKATLLEEYYHSAQQGQLPANYNPPLFRKITLVAAQFHYNEVRAKIKVLAWLEEVGPGLVEDPDVPVTQDDLDKAKAKYRKQLAYHTGELLKKLESLNQQDQITGQAPPAAERRARDIWTKCLIAAGVILGL